MNICIEGKNVSYQYPLTSKAAVKHMDFRMEEGKCYGIIGPNAGGKSTLCNIIRGICPNFYKGEIRGEVLIEGKKLEDWDEGELARRIGYVFQDPFAQISGTKQTVFEEIGIGLENLGIDVEIMIPKILEMSRIVDVEQILDKNPLRLSGGQCQRVAFASVLALDSSIVVIDEPTSQLDPQGIEEVFKIIERLKAMKKTIIIAEHKVDYMAKYCDEIIAVNNGHIIAHGDVKTLFTDPTIAEADIEIPQPVRLALAMCEAGLPLKNVPLTFEEAVAYLREGGYGYGN